MKKAVVAAAAVLTLAANIPAYADVSYDEEQHAIIGGAAGYQTVFVQKANEVYSPKNILYVGENSSGFDAVVEFMLKEPAEAGDYIVRMGGSEAGSMKEVRFTISSGEEQGDIQMTKIVSADEGDNVRVGFTADGVSLPGYKSILVTYTDENGGQINLGYPLSKLIDISMEGETSFGLQINNVPSKYKESISVSLSTREVSY